MGSSTCDNKKVRDEVSDNEMSDTIKILALRARTPRTNSIDRFVPSNLAEDSENTSCTILDSELWTQNVTSPCACFERTPRPYRLRKRRTRHQET